MTTGTRRASSAENSRARKRSLHARRGNASKQSKMTNIDKSEVKAPEAAAKFLAFTIDASTAQIVKLVSLDASGASHELSEDEKASLATAASKDRLAGVLEQAFEAGIACAMGEGVADDLAEDVAEDKAHESEEDAELRHLLLKPLIEHSAAKDLMKPEVLNRAILETLIEQSMKSRSASAQGGPGESL
jgi:hypothetical protein